MELIYLRHLKQMHRPSPNRPRRRFEQLEARHLLTTTIGGAFEFIESRASDWDYGVASERVRLPFNYNVLDSYELSAVADNGSSEVVALVQVSVDDGTSGTLVIEATATRGHPANTRAAAHFDVHISIRPEDIPNVYNEYWLQYDASYSSGPGRFRRYYSEPWNGAYDYESTGTILTGSLGSGIFFRELISDGAYPNWTDYRAEISWQFVPAAQDLAFTSKGTVEVRNTASQTSRPLSSGTIIAPNEQIVLSATAASLADSRLSAFPVVFYASLDNQIDPAVDAVIGRASANRRSPGSNDDFAFDVTRAMSFHSTLAALGLDATTYDGSPIYFGAVIDPDSQVDTESNRSNNTLLFEPYVAWSLPTLASVTFGGDGFSYITSDKWGASEGTDDWYYHHYANQWYDINGNGVATDNGDLAAPVMYAMGTTPTLSATWNSFSGGTTPPSFEPPSTDVLVRASSDAFQLGFAPGKHARAQWSADGKLSLEPTAVDDAIVNTVFFYDDLEIDWELSFDDGLTWQAAGRSVNDMYVTKTASSAEFVGEIWVR